MKGCQPSWLRSTPTIPVSKLQRISSYPLLALLTFATARVLTEQIKFLEVPLLYYQYTLSSL